MSEKENKKSLGSSVASGMKDSEVQEPASLSNPSIKGARNNEGQKD